MSLAAGKLGSAFATTTTARAPSAGRSSFAPGEAMPIEGVLSSDGAGPEEESVRDDGSDWDDEGKRTGWNRQKHRRPIIVSPFGSFLTTFEVDRTLFNYLAFASEPPPGLIVNFGRVARYYEVIYDVIRLGPRRLGGEYDHLH